MAAPIPPHIRTYLDGILHDAGMRDLDPEQHEQLIQDLFERLDQFLDTVIRENLAAPFEAVRRQAFIDFRHQYLSANEQSGVEGVEKE